MPFPVSQLNDLALDQSLFVQLHFCMFAMPHLIKAKNTGELSVPIGLHLTVLCT